VRSIQLRRFVILSSVFERSAQALLAVTAAAAMVSAALGQAPQKKVKDQAEYDLYTNATKETDATKRLVFLNTWQEKYPDSDFKEERLVIFLISYTQLAQAPKVRAAVAYELDTASPPAPDSRVPRHR
jgi:hypothetical protein